MRKIILFIWQLPQNLLGLVIIIFFAEFDFTYKQIYIYRTTKFAGGSLGSYIIIGTTEGPVTISHEYGHCRQSMILGPAYLLAVGLPSFIMAMISRKNPRFRANYFNRWPETWADKLGGVKRD